MKLSIKIALIVFLAIFLSSSIILIFTLPVFQTLSIFFKLLLGFVFIVFPITILAWFFLYQILVKPIIYIKNISKIIAAGNLGTGIQIKGVDEISELAKNFNTIINNLTSGMQSMANSLKSERLKETELAKSNNELGNEKAKAEALLGSIGDGIIAIDSSKRIFLFNFAACVLTGFSQSEVMNKPYYDFLKFLDEKDKSISVDFIAKVLNGEKINNLNYIVFLHKDGSKVPVSDIASPILDQDKKVSGVIVALRDIRRERQLEKLKDEFVSIASHELRTPMTAIKGLVSMIEEGDYGTVNESLKDPLSDIALSTSRLINLVNDMLDVSRIEAGRIKFDMSDILLEDVIKEVRTTSESLLNKKDIHLNLGTIIPDKIRADLNKVKQIVLNLVGNALKFTDNGTIDISSKLTGKYVYISVSDTGIGMSSENQMKLFSKFSQIDTVTDGRPPGTGLGLYISREFARKMGGDLWIEHSQEGIGTTFTFSLPLANTDIAQMITDKLSDQITE